MKINTPRVINDILGLSNTSLKSKKIKKADPEVARLYSNVNRNNRRRMKRARENWINEQSEISNSWFSVGNSNIALKTLRKLTKLQSPRIKITADESGPLLTETSAVTRRCEELYNWQLHPNNSITCIIQNNFDNNLPKDTDYKTVYEGLVPFLNNTSSTERKCKNATELQNH